MARPKEFDPTEMLYKVLDIFWYYGYEATTFQILTKELGIGRQSLYDTYGSKRDLFFAALKHYANQKMSFLVRILEGSGSVKDAIARLFHETLISLKDDRNRKGCFMLNTVMELVPHDLEIAKFVESIMEEEVHVLYKALTRAEDRIPWETYQRNPMTVARFLNNVRYGLVVTSKRTSDLSVLDGIIDETLLALEMR